MVIKSRADLDDWTAYRKQTQDGLAALMPGESVHVSQDDFEFHINGRSWVGRIVLVGSKGDQSWSALKKDGLTFRSGVGTRGADGTTVHVVGIGKGLLKEANKTLTRMSLSTSLVVGGPAADGDASEEVDDEAPAEARADEAALAERVRATKAKLRADITAALGDAEQASEVTRLVRLAADQEKQGRLAGAQAALDELAIVLRRGKVAADAKQDAAGADIEPVSSDDARAEVAQRKAGLFARVKAVVARRAELRDSFAEVLRVADQHEKAGDFVASIAAYDTLDERLGDAEAPGDEEAKALAAARKAPLVQRIKAGVVARPELREPLTTLVRAADGHEKAAAHAAQLATYDTIEDLLADDAEPEDGEAAAARVDLRDWAQYRKWLRPRLRQLSRSAAVVEPIFVGKQRREFVVDGKPFWGHLVMVGPKCRAMLQRQKREGTPFAEVAGFLREADGRIVAPGLAAAAVAAGNRTLQRLRLGCLLDAGGGGAATAGAAGSTARAPSPDFAASWPPAKAAWQQAIEVVGGQLEQLRSHLLTTRDPDLVRIAEFGLNAITGDHRVPLQVAMAEIDAAADGDKLPRVARARAIVTSFQAHLANDERVEACDGNPFGVAVTIRDTLLGGLVTLADALDDADAD